MNDQLHESENVSELSAEELDLVAGGAETHQTTCRVDKNGNGWCYLKVD